MPGCCRARTLRSCWPAQTSWLARTLGPTCRGSLLSDPRYDALVMVVLTIMDDNEDVADMRYTTRVLACDESEKLPILGMPDLQVCWSRPQCCIGQPAFSKNRSCTRACLLKPAD